jgi:elongation factor P--(R)-beta-lysine ligase
LPREIEPNDDTQTRQPTLWWHPRRHRDRRPALIARHTIKQALRSWFLDQGFIEVDTAALQVSPGNELHLHAFATRFAPLDGGTERTFYLHTSPEFACKKLLAAGETKIFTFASCYRNGELTRLHHPEFTMLEWYRAGADYQDLMEDCEAILKVTAEAIAARSF